MSDQGQLLTKPGQKLTLKLVAPSLTDLLMNSSWDTPDYDDGGDVSLQWDADIGVLFVDENNNVDGGLTYLSPAINPAYNYLHYPTESEPAASRSSDNTTGKGEGVDEFALIMTKELERLRPNVKRAICIMHLYGASERFTDPSRSVKGQTFRHCKNLKMELVDAGQDKVLGTVLPGNDFADASALVLGALVKSSMGWTYENILQPFSGLDYITDIGRAYGLTFPASWPRH